MTTSKKTIAVVTGASRPEGIGIEVARQLGQLGMTVLVTARDGEVAAKRERELADAGIDARGFELDLETPASVEALGRRVSSAESTCSSTMPLRPAPTGRWLFLQIWTARSRR